ncbi:Tim44/TimA family putative adaptor protein [Bartonella sp. DGB2]|uniref:Tim44/TimA family putative adaptor protein n=1 Tax=Bartonella sp. DGB2 TaxID=3388426 RepID=UPI00398FE0B9
MEFDIVIILAFVAVVVIFIQLRNVLGKRVGFERPPFDPYTSTRTDSAIEKEPPASEVQSADVLAQIDEAARSNSVLHKGLKEIFVEDPNFSPRSFLGGARVAYEAILTAFACDDRQTLNALLAPEALESFVAALKQRETAGERVEFRFVSIEEADFVAAGLEGNYAAITIRLVSQIISATYNAEGHLVDGNPEEIVEIRDLWTFARNTKSEDPNWRLRHTEEDKR